MLRKFEPPEKLEVEVASLKHAGGKRQRRRRPWQLLLSGLAGLLLALIWHFAHFATEQAALDPANLDFWLHLLFEGFLALYGAAFYFILWRLVERFLPRR